MMESIKLRPWPFDNRVVKLHWFGHVRLTSSKKWRITVAFEDRNQVELIQYPIGLLPILRLGQYYQKGYLLTSQKEGMIDVTRVHDLTVGYTSKSIDVARRFQYFLYKKRELINQKVWSFQSGSNYYYIPHTELIRALFTNNKVLANALLRPKGLVYLLSHQQINGRHASFDFSQEIPATIISDDFVRHFVWLYSVPEIRNAFESVQTNVYANAAKSNGLTNGMPLELVPPKLKDSFWTFRGKRQGKHVFIYELLDFTVMKLPFDEIDYSHVSIKKRVYSNNPKKKRISESGKEQDFEVDPKEENQAKEDTHQPVVKSEATQMTFEGRTEVKRTAKQEQQVNQGDIYTTKDGRGGALLTAASVDESIAGGSIQPIDFKTLEITYERNGYGLEDFYKMIQYLKEMHLELRISMNLINLPIGRKFSWLPDGRRRVCAVVRIEKNGRKSVYILEVARPDQRSLSTLIVQMEEVKNRKGEEETIHGLLYGLVFNGGNWRKRSLQKVTYSKLRHTSKDSEHWAERVYEKLM
ncbi:Tn7-like element transposition protein TnsE [Halobacillus ihumii]|uniref:Tn7-like element transposition protein TnsE n=1 Tax=Halobacillus ihumii TaxID=2686092 RepID=UPI0013D80AD7|nr:Tn7-like element transposition protein TnsE [Halobacillus ihumii]